MRRKPPTNEFARRPPSTKEFKAAERMAKKVDSLTLRDDEGNEIGTVGSLYGMMTAATKTENDAE